MTAGELNHRITIKQSTPTRDSYGQSVIAWSDVGALWAGVITTGGGEFYAAQKKNAETTALFTVRYTTAIDTKMQIVYGGKTYEILDINDVNGANVELQISAKAVV